MADVVTALEPVGYIPLGFWLTQHHPELKGAARVLYMALGQFANARNTRPSKRELRMATGFSENTVDDALRQLRNDGWLRVQKRDGGANTYCMQRGPWLVAPPQQLGGEGPPSDRGSLKAQRKSEKATAAEACAELGQTLAALEADPVPSVAASFSEPEENRDSPPAAPLPTPRPSSNPTLPGSLKSCSSPSEGSFSARPGLRKACGPPKLELATVRALVSRYGLEQAKALERVFSAAKWHRAGLAEQACALLLERRGARDPKCYVHRLYDEAVLRLDLEAEELAAREHWEYRRPAPEPDPLSRAPPPPGRIVRKPVSEEAREYVAKELLRTG